LHGAGEGTLVCGEGVQVGSGHCRGGLDLAVEEPHVLHETFDGLLGVCDAVGQFLGPWPKAPDLGHTRHWILGI
jgi:hypothetical protein